MTKVELLQLITLVLVLAIGCACYLAWQERKKLNDAIKKKGQP